MPLRHQTPAYLPYLKARLRPLTRPTVWGTAIILSVVGLTTWEYSLHPDFLSSLSNNQATTLQNPQPSSLSPEDQNIAADIDSTSVLDNDLNQAIPGLSKTNSKSEATNSKNLLDNQVTQKPASAQLTTATGKPNDQSNTSIATSKPSVAASKIDNPFLIQAQNLLQANGDSDGKFLGATPSAGQSEQLKAGENSSSLGLQPNQTTTEQNQSGVKPSNPLKEALNQLTDKNSGATANGKQPLSTNTSTTQTAETPSRTDYTPLTTTNTTNSQNSYTEPIPSQSTANAPPVVPVVPTVAPVTPSNAEPYSIQGSSQGRGTGINPGLTSTFGNSALPPSQLPSSNRNYLRRY